MNRCNLCSSLAGMRREIEESNVSVFKMKKGSSAPSVCAVPPTACTRLKASIRRIRSALGSTTAEWDNKYKKV